MSSCPAISNHGDKDPSLQGLAIQRLHDDLLPQTPSKVAADIEKSALEEPVKQTPCERVGAPMSSASHVNVAMEEDMFNPFSTFKYERHRVRYKPWGTAFTGEHSSHAHRPALPTNHPIQPVLPDINQPAINANPITEHDKTYYFSVLKKTHGPAEPHTTHRKHHQFLAMLHLPEKKKGLDTLSPSLADSRDYSRRILIEHYLFWIGFLIPICWPVAVFLVRRRTPQSGENAQWLRRYRIMVVYMIIVGVLIAIILIAKTALLAGIRFSPHVSKPTIMKS